MADVTGRDRARILLLMSLLIATVFIGLAVVTNGGVYTENLGTRETGSEASVTAEYRSEEAVYRNDDVEAPWSEVE